MNPSKQIPPVRWQSVALPTEHGGWSFIGEPLLLGLLVAPSLGGVALAIGAMGIFMLRQPLKLYIKDLRNHRMYTRTYTAARFAMIYGVITVMAGILTLIWLPSIDVALPMLLAAPLIALQALYELRGQGRHIIAETCGALATGAVASFIVMMQGWAPVPALGLWLALAVKGVTAVLYVRSRLRLERGTAAAIPLTLSAHAVGAVLLLGAAYSQLLPWATVVVMVILVIRAILGLSPRRTSLPAKSVGLQEALYGVVYVLLVVLGYRM